MLRQAVNGESSAHEAKSNAGDKHGARDVTIWLA
jgi:hypothetical protein